MRRTRRTALAGIAAVALLLGPAPAHGEPAAAPPPADGRAHTVTLVTGDRARVGADGKIVFLPGPGRQKTGHRVLPEGEARYVVPDDAREAFGDGRLDRRLFDVTGLIRDGYADTDGLPVIVKGAARSLTAEGTRLDSIGATASTMDGDALAELWRGMSGTGLTAGAATVWLDARMRTALDVSVPQVGAPAAWAAGYDGTGVTVAILDTGLDFTHPDLAGRVTAARDFTGTRPDASDDVGHGTHVASILAGSGAASGGRFKGVAPGAKLLVGKVCGLEWCAASDMIAGMEWAAAQGADVVNMSVGGSAHDGEDPVVAALERLSRNGPLFTVAAGNEGAPGSIASPGIAPSALTVSSVTKTGERSPFSSQGPAVGHAMKPDIAAPGSGITAARAAGTEGEGPYATHSGTSMATPHVAGAAALMKQEHPDWDGERIKRALVSSAAGLAGLTAFQEGTGRLDLARAIGQTVTADGGVDFGLFSFPQDQPTATRTVTYTNDGDAEVTLDVALTEAAPGFAVDRPQVTVPAHGTASVTVSYDPDPARGPGNHAAELTASNAATAVRTALGAETERELYDLTVQLTLPAGESLDFGDVIYRDLATGNGGYLTLREQRQSVRVTPGRYLFAVLTLTGDGGPARHRTLAASEADVHADTAVPLDLREAGPLTIDLAGEGETFEYGQAELTVGEGELTAEMGVYAEGVRLAPGGTTAPTRLSVFGQFGRDGEAYYLAHTTTGPLPAGLDLTRHPEELATVRHVIEGQGVAGAETYMSFGPAGNTQLSGGVRKAGSEFTVHYTPGDWDAALVWGGLEDHQTGRFTAVTGRTPTVRWNRAPLGAGFAGEHPVSRINGLMLLDVGMFTGPDAARPTVTRTSGRKLTLDVNGERVLTSENDRRLQFPIPNGLSGDFTLRIDAARDVEWSTIGTRSSVEFHWRQGFQADTRLDAPLSAVRLNATGVKDGFAAAALPQLVSLTVDKAGAAATTSLTFEVSHDDGKTWTAVPLARYGDTAVAVLSHPAGATGVSTRMTAVDADGNSTTQTSIRSFGLR